MEWVTRPDDELLRELGAMEVSKCSMVPLFLQEILSWHDRCMEPIEQTESCETEISRLFKIQKKPLVKS